MANPNWVKGVSGNPAGKPKVFSLNDLKEAMEKVAEVKKQTLLERAVEMAYKEPSVMIALLKKIIPDQIEHSGEVTEYQIVYKRS